jgi:hypothetical protein
MTMAHMEPLLMFLLNVVQRSIIHSLLCSPDHGGFMVHLLSDLLETSRLCKYLLSVRTYAVFMQYDFNTDIPRGKQIPEQSF